MVLCKATMESSRSFGPSSGPKHTNTTLYRSHAPLKTSRFLFEKGQQVWMNMSHSCRGVSMNMKS